jgi:predicted ATPase
VAAYCAITMGNATGGNDEADQVRSQITDFAKWIIHEYLTELRPRLWAHTARGFDNNLQVRCADRFTASGEADALRIIRTVFHRDVANGNRIMFTDNGPICQPA